MFIILPIFFEHLKFIVYNFVNSLNKNLNQFILMYL